MSTPKFPNCVQHQTGAAGFRAEGGQALIESVVTFGILIVLIVGIVNFGFIFRTLISVTNAANIGAMYASTSENAAGDLANIRLAALADSENWHCDDPTVSSKGGADESGNPNVSVTVSCQIVDLITFPGVPSEITLSRTVVRRIMP